MARSADNLNAVLQDTANAIKAKKGSQATICPRDFADQVASIPTGTTPTGTLDIKANGDHYNVSSYKYADVKVQGISYEDSNAGETLDLDFRGLAEQLPCWFVAVDSDSDEYRPDDDGLYYHLVTTYDGTYYVTYYNHTNLYGHYPFEISYNENGGGFSFSVDSDFATEDNGYIYVKTGLAFTRTPNYSADQYSPTVNNIFGYLCIGIDKEYSEGNWPPYSEAVAYLSGLEKTIVFLDVFGHAVGSVNIADIGMPEYPSSSGSGGGSGSGE